MSTDTKRGRPEGSVQTPISLLRAEMREQLRLSRRLREIVATAADKLDKALKESDNPELFLKIIETLGTWHVGQSKSVDATAKHVLAEEGTKEPTDADIMEILKEK